MQESASSFFTVWSNFYVITGSSSAALTGLMFVVVTLVAGGRSQAPKEAHAEGFAAFSTPTVVHFCAAFLISGILSAPWRSLVHAGTMMGLTGLFGILYGLRAMYRTKRQTAYRPIFEDWVWYAIVPLVAYVAVAAAAILLPTVPATAMFALAGATMLLIFVGIHNAWDVVTYLALDHIQEADERPASDSPDRS